MLVLLRSRTLKNMHSTLLMSMAALCLMRESITRIVKLKKFFVIGIKYSFEIQEILLVPHGGWHNDTIVVVEKKII